MRLGLHVHTRGRNELVRRYIDEVRPPVMKWLVDGADPELMRYARSLGVKVVLRRVADTLSPGATGGRILERQVLTMADQYRGCFDYVEAANEELQGRDDPKQLDKLAELMLDFMQVCDARGHKACAFNFSVGQPELERWTRPAMLACLDYAARHGHAIGVHEYYKPVPWQGVDGWAAAGSASADGWWMLRIVKALTILRARGEALPAFIVTESGRDDVSGTPGGGKGWRDDKAGHDYAEYMAQYCRHLRHHPEVLGLVDFGFASTAGGDPRWHSFDLAAEPQVFDRMIAKMKEIPMGKPAPAPAPTPADPAAVINRPAAHRSSRAGERAAWIVVHSTDTPVGGSVAGTVNYLVDNPNQVSIHELVTPAGVYRMVADGEAAHHAGYGTLPDGTTGAEVNRRSWGIEIYQIHGQPCAADLVDVAARRIAEACRRLGIADTSRIVGHREIDPGRRSDPVGVDMGVLRARVLQMLSAAPAPVPAGESVDVAALWREADARQSIQLNPSAALQRTIRADGLAVTSGEWDHGTRFVAQRAEPLVGGPATVYVYDKQTGRVTRYRRAA